VSGEDEADSEETEAEEDQGRGEKKAASSDFSGEDDFLETEYCVCHRLRREKLLMMCAGAQCPSGGHFHHSCLYMTAGQASKLDKSWLCPTCQAAASCVKKLGLGVPSAAAP
jgi:hypothetical protein